MKTWAILVTKQGDQWVVFIPEIHRHQTRHLERVRDRARDMLSAVAGVDAGEVIIRFHNLSTDPLDLDLATGPLED